MKEFFKVLEKDKIKINWNKNPIPMEQFLSFLTVDVIRLTKFLGSDTGWTKLIGDNDLVISGGIISGVEYLDSILYGKHLDNPYNNFINPFYMFDILNEKGKAFFIEYYKRDIRSILKEAKSKLDHAKTYQQGTFNFWAKYGL